MIVKRKQFCYGGAMQKDPILYKRISKRSLRKGTSVIGIYGMRRYVGVTHLTLLLAFYLSDICGYKVVVIEASGNDDIGSLAKMYHVQSESTNTNKFSFRNITFVGQALTHEIGAYHNSSYDYCLLDLGGNYKRAANELLRCDLKIVIGTAAPWQRIAWQKLEEMLTNIKDLSSWCIINNLSTKKQKTKINGIRNYYVIGLEPNLLHASKDAIGTFQNLMNFK